MTRDAHPCPAGPGGDAGAAPRRADPELAAAGWVRRHVADAARAREAVELYQALGYEVRVEALDPADFAPDCGPCALAARGACVLIYTRSSGKEQLVSATRCLRDEHQVILRVLDCLQVALERSRQSGRVSRDVFEPFVEFFRGFADRCHHGKEEARLFPCLEQRGLPREGGPIGVMLEEHRQARLRVIRIADELDAAEAGDGAAVQTVLEQGQKLIELLRSHIEKEDHCLFAMADQLIRGAELERLGREYAATEEEPGYGATYGRCRGIADRLADTWGR